MDNFVFKRYGVIIETAILGFKIGGGFTEHGMHILTARLTWAMRMVRPRPVAVLNIPTLALLGNAAPANAMDKSPTCPLRGPSMTARRFGQVKVQDGDDQTAVCKMCDHMQRAKSIAITPCVLTVPAKWTCLMLRYGQGLGLGERC